jgi:hypothetical protein
LLGYFQGKLKGYPVWSNPNNIAPFLDEHSQPPAACPSIVNAKALGMNTFLPWHCSLPSFTDTVTAGVGTYQVMLSIFYHWWVLANLCRNLVT